MITLFVSRVCFSDASPLPDEELTVATDPRDEMVSYPYASSSSLTSPRRISDARPLSPPLPHHAREARLVDVKLLSQP